MLQIRLTKPDSESGGGSAKLAPADNVRVACPDHLVLADLPVAKSLGSASASAVIKTVGCRSRHQLAPHCLKSFLKKTEFESHVNEIHADLLHPLKEKEGNESEATSARKPQVHEHEDKSPLPQSRDLPPLRPSMHPMSLSRFPGKVPNHLSEQQHDSNQSQVFDRVASQIHFPQQIFDPQGSRRQDSASNQNPVLPATQFGYSPYVSDGTQQFFGAPTDTVRPSAMVEAGSEQGTLLGFQPGPAGPMNFAQNYPQPWNMISGPLEAPLVAQGATDGFLNVSDPQGLGFYHGDYGQNASVLPLNLPPSAANKTMERRPQSLPLPQPLPSPPLLPIYRI